MISSNPFERNENEIPTGTQTELTESVRELAAKLQEKGSNVLENINQHIKKMRVVPGGRYSSERSASDILTSDEYCGCQEAGLARLALLRASGIKTSYIQAVRKDSLEKFDLNAKIISLSGHVFLRAEVDGKEVIVNSTNGRLTPSLPEEFILGREGLDAWDIGLRTQEDMIRMYDSLKRATH